MSQRIDQNRDGSIRLTYHLAQLYEKAQQDPKHAEILRRYEEWVEETIVKNPELKDFAAARKRKSIMDVEDAMTRDQMTGLRNRGYFFTKLNDVVHTIKQNGGEAAVLFVDISEFKTLNDTYGHAAGDEAIKRVGQLLERLTKDNGLSARFGGDEFAAVLLGECADTLAEQFSRQFHDFTFPYKGQEIPVKLSLGIAVVDPEFLAEHHYNIDEVVNHAVHVADDDMYKDKKQQGHKIRSKPRGYDPTPDPTMEL